MSLNKFMHPRNRYKISRPDFKDLGQKYPEFKMHLVENEKGKPVLDFQNPEALRVLTICMLKEDYGLKIDLPPDRLVPTLPLRLNYVHWIEDITADWNKQELSAIDIGTGACCVYPILAVSANPWRFLATEADEVNYSYAIKNMQENQLTEKIKVIKVSSNTILEGVIGQTEDTYDFCMCNPPFFSDHFEAQGLVSRSPSRPEAKTMSTASPQEGIVQGGEVAFVRRMIEESNFLQNRVRVYTTMLGKKASLAPLKEILRRCKITNFATTEFCQGKTMRWGLAWTFDKSVIFPKSAFAQGKKEGKKSLVHTIPTQVGERREPLYDLVIFFKQMFSELKIHCREGKQTQFFALLTLTAAENTWIHSRRKRRQMMRETTAISATVASETSSGPAADASETSISSAPQCDESASGDIAECGDRVKGEGRSNISDCSVSESSGTVKSDSEPTKFSNVSNESGRGAMDESEESILSNTVVEMSDSAGDHSRSAALSMDTTDSDRDQGQELKGTGALPASGVTNAGAEHRKRKSETTAVKTSDSPPLKRVKLECPELSSGVGADAETQKIKSETEPVESLNSPSAKPSKSQSPKLQSSEEGVSQVLQASSHEGHISSAQGKLDSSSAEAASSEGREGTKAKDRPPAQFVLKCHMSVRVQGSDLAVELTWLDGQDIQLMHQLMQVFKNRLAQRKSS